MQRITLYKIGFFSLLILNIALIVFLISRRPFHRLPPHNGQPPFMQEAIETLQLKDEQIAEFQALAKEHGEEMKALQTKQTEAIARYFETLKDESQAAESENLLNAIKDLETEKVTHTRKHFEDVKNILNDDQLKNYPMFVDRAIEALLGNSKNAPTPPPRDI